jgi:predicted nucleic acid-binding protein
VSEVWIADAGPVIILAKAGYLHLLTTLPDDLLLPSPVVREIRKGPIPDPARRAVDGGLGTHVRVDYIPVAVRSVVLLDPGERSVLALALRRPGCKVVLDDAKGRAAADALGIAKIGTLGVLARAKKQGHIPVIAAAVRAVLAAGLYANAALVESVVTSLGELWP